MKIKIECNRKAEYYLFKKKIESILLIKFILIETSKQSHLVGLAGSLPPVQSSQIGSPNLITLSSPLNKLKNSAHPINSIQPFGPIQLNRLINSLNHNTHFIDLNYNI